MVTGREKETERGGEKRVRGKGGERESEEERRRERGWWLKSTKKQDI